jgi:hypothetical protein
MTPFYKIMRTRHGIYYDLTKSPYKFITPDSNTTYVFSSDLHMMKFEDQYINNRSELNLKFESRYHVHFNLMVMPDLILYRRIEKRGFLVITDGGHKLCQDNLRLDGEKVTLKS